MSLAYDNLDDNTSLDICQEQSLRATEGSPRGSVATPLLDTYSINSTISKLLCAYGNWHYLNTKTGEIAQYNCRKWDCPIHGHVLAHKWATFVINGQPDRMITTTDVSFNPQKALVSHQKFWRILRHDFGRDQEYVRAAEVGEKGKLHYHYAHKGSFIPVRQLSGIASKVGFGRIVDIRQADEGIGNYMTMGKYITKGKAPAGHRKIAVSRGYPRLVEAEPADKGDWILIRERSESDD